MASIPRKKYESKSEYNERKKKILSYRKERENYVKSISQFKYNKGHRGSTKKYGSYEGYQEIRHKKNWKGISDGSSSYISPAVVVKRYDPLREDE